MSTLKYFMYPRSKLHLQQPLHISRNGCSAAVVTSRGLSHSPSLTTHTHTHNHTHLLLLSHTYSTRTRSRSLCLSHSGSGSGSLSLSFRSLSVSLFLSLSLTPPSSPLCQVSVQQPLHRVTYYIS